MSNREDELEIILRAFLEQEPLYHDVIIPSGFVEKDIWPMKITYYCQIDRAQKTFHHRFPPTPLRPGIEDLRYKCGDCNTQQIMFYVRGFKKDDGSDANVEKIGQYPPWRIEPSQDLKRLIGNGTLDLYKKSLVCLSQGYGLGALVYLRRVVEDNARSLVQLLAEFQEHEGAPSDETQELITLAKGKDIETMLRRASELFPAHLRPGNENPMSVIYDAASVAIHREDESTSTKKANAIVKALEYVIPTLARQLVAKKEFIQAMKELKTQNHQLNK